MSLRHAILAMLDIEPGSGYDLVKRFDQSVGHFWSASYQQIYRELQKLESADFLQAEDIAQQGKPDKKNYQVTDQGVLELQSWLEKPAKTMKVKEPLLIKVLAGGRADKAKLIDDIRQQKHLHAETLQQYAELNDFFIKLGDSLTEAHFLLHQTVKLGIKMEQAWLEWAEQTIDAIGNKC